MNPIERLETIWSLLTAEANNERADRATIRAQMLSVVALQTEYSRLCCEFKMVKPNPTFVKAVAEAITLLDASKLDEFKVD